MATATTPEAVFVGMEGVGCTAAAIRLVCPINSREGSPRPRPVSYSCLYQHLVPKVHFPALKCSQGMLFLASISVLGERELSDPLFFPPFLPLPPPLPFGWDEVSRCFRRFWSSSRAFCMSAFDI